MDQEKLLQLQMQMRHNNEDYKNFIEDLDSWSADLKEKEKGNNISSQSINANKNSNNNVIINSKSCVKKPKIKGSDYKSWEKFDVETALEEIDKEPKVNHKVQSSDKLKQDGNEHYRVGNYEKAVEKYTEAIALNPQNDILLTNRALSLAKLCQFETSSMDCTKALSLNNQSVKALYQRAKCRIALNRLPEAIVDLKSVLQIDPCNRLALAELNQLEKSKSNDRVGRVEPLFQPPPGKVSYKPLMKINITDVNPSAFVKGKAMDDQLTERSTNSKVLPEEKPMKDKACEIPIDKIINNEITDTESMVTQPESKSMESQLAEISMETVCHPLNNKSLKIDVEHELSEMYFKAPQTAIQLGRDLARHKGNLCQLAVYVSALERGRYSKVIGHSLDESILLNIIGGLKGALELSLFSTEIFVESLLCLQKVPRFSSTWQMLSAEDKKPLQHIVRSLNENYANKLSFCL